MPDTNLGRFLYSKRIRRGYESTTEYLKNYANIPISEPYYRDIESGRKVIKVDKSESLCIALRLDKREFYYHLLRDVLPEEVFQNVVQQTISDTTFSAVTEEFDKMTDKLRDFRRAYEKCVIEEPYIVSDETVYYLDKNFEVLPLVHYIYMRETCKFSDLQEIRAKTGIKKVMKQIIAEFDKYDIAVINKKKKVVSRHSEVFRIPKTEAGIKLKNRFLEAEIEKLKNAKNRERFIGPNNTFEFSGILCIGGDEGLSKVSEKLTDLMVQLELENDRLEESSVVPYFVSIAFASREEYMT